jgi:hypothetical protein
MPYNRVFGGGLPILNVKCLNENFGNNVRASSQPKLYLSTPIVKETLSNGKSDTATINNIGYMSNESIWEVVYPFPV